MTASSSDCTPLFLNEAPQSTGTIQPLQVARRIAPWISASVSSSPAKYFSSRSSSCSIAASIRSCRHFSTSALSASGTGISVKFLPIVASSKTRSTCRSRSMCPVKVSPEPTGSWIGKAFRVSRARIMSTQR